MKPSLSSNAKNTKSKFLPLIVIVVGVVAIVGLAWAGVSIFSLKTPTNSLVNHAEEAAESFEAALAKAGAKKQCSRGDRGSGSSNTLPNYKAIFEVPGNRETAEGTVIAAAKEAGFALTDDSSRANAENNKLLADRTSKKSTYTDLLEGNVILMVTAYGSHTFTSADSQFCTVTKSENPPADMTTVDFTVNLPEVKR